MYTSLRYEEMHGYPVYIYYLLLKQLYFMVTLLQHLDHNKYLLIYTRQSHHLAI